MNITQITEEEMSKLLPFDWKQGDKLANMFELQKELMRNLVKAGKLKRMPNPNDWATKEGQQLLRTTFFYIIEEVMETSLAMRNAKEWKKEEILPDKNHIDEEIAGDCLHFLLEAFIQLGLDENKIYEIYCKKNAVNTWRIQSQY